MGFLDHSTNNIIVDAVLTDVGRRLLSQNDGSFFISQFALSDEEIDYSIIQKFGRNVGQEKIEKNTPVLEALTKSNLGQKYRLLSVSNSYLASLPDLNLTSHTGDLITLTKASSSDTATLTFEITPTEGETVDDDLLDEFFFVEVNNIFLDIPEANIDIINIDNTVVYRIGTSTAGDASGRTQLNFRVTLKGFSQSQFDTYKITSTSSYVKNFIKVTGATSGLTKNVEVRIINS